MTTGLLGYVLALTLGFGVSGALLWLLTRRRVRGEQKVMKNYFLMGLSGLMAKIAEADGNVSHDEITLATKYFQDMKLNESEKALCVGNFITSRRHSTNLRDLTQRFMAYAPPAASEFLYFLLWQLSGADGVLDPAEDKLLKELTTYLGLSETQYARMKSGARPSFSASTLRAAGVPESLVALA